MLENLFNFAYGYLRPIFKWFLRKFTRLCELQRICYGTEEGAPRTIGVEYSLRMSRQPRINQIMVTINTKLEKIENDHMHKLVSTFLEVVLETKLISNRSHPDFGYLLRKCIESICSYQKLYYSIESLRITTFDSSNLDVSFVYINKILKCTMNFNLFSK